MYTRKIYEPESKLRIQIPGHGVGSAAGSAAQQEVWVRPSPALAPQKTSGASEGSKKKTWLSKGVFEDGYQFGDGGP